MKQKLKQQLGLVLVTVFLSIIIGGLIQICSAQEAIPLPDPTYYGDLPLPKGETGEQKAIFLVNRVVDNVKYIIGAVAILFIIVSGFRMITAQGNEETVEKQSKAILWGIVGLAIIGLSSELVDIFSVEKGGFLKDQARLQTVSKLFDDQVQVIVSFIKYIIGGLAILFIIRSGFRMIAMGAGNPEELEKDKKNLVWASIGLILIVVANNLINNVLYVVKRSPYPGVEGVTPGISPEGAVDEVVGITNLIVSIAAPLAVAVLVAGGIWYLVAAGNEENQGKAKKMIIAAIIGLILIFGAFAIVSTLISGDIGEDATYEDARQLEEAVEAEFES